MQGHVIGRWRLQEEGLWDGKEEKVVQRGVWRGGRERENSTHLDSAESGDQMTGVGQCQLQSVGGLLPGAGCCHQLPHDTKGESTGVRRDPGRPTIHRDAPQHLAQALLRLLQLSLLEMLPTVLLYRTTLLRQVCGRAFAPAFPVSVVISCLNFMSTPSRPIFGALLGSLWSSLKVCHSPKEFAKSLPRS